eukprot:3026-Heterococcus_DN1.PRE.4
MRACAYYGASQNGAFCSFQDAQCQFGITYKKLMKLIDKPGEAVNEHTACKLYSAVSSLGSDPINCLRDEQGNIVTKLRNDGYLYATSMCDSFDKLWANFARLDRTARFLQALSTKTGIPIHTTQGSKGLIDSKPGGFGQEWWSVEFELAVNDLAESFLRGTITTEQSLAAAQSLSEAVSSDEHMMKRVKYGDDAVGVKWAEAGYGSLRRIEHGLMIHLGTNLAKCPHTAVTESVSTDVLSTVKSTYIVEHPHCADA